MSEENKNEEVVEEQQQEENQVEETKEDMVSAAELRKIQAQLADIQKERDEARAALKEVDLEQMKAQERWKEIAELREKEANEANEKYSNMAKAVNADKKMNAINMAAQAAGMRAEEIADLERYDFPEVFIETTSTGKSRVVGAKEAIQNLKVKKPYLFGKPSSALNSSSPEVVDGGKITIDQVKKAGAEYAKTKSQESLAKYQKLVMQFKSQ